MPITTHKPPESVAGWTAAQLIKRDVLSTAVRHGTITLAQAEVTRETVDAVFDPLHEDGTLQDAMEEFRQAVHRTLHPARIRARATLAPHHHGLEGSN